jgi:hypothetical protein
VVEEEEVVLVVLIRRHRRAVGAAVRRAMYFHFQVAMVPSSENRFKAVTRQTRFQVTCKELVESNFGPQTHLNPTSGKAMQTRLKAAWSKVTSKRLSHCKKKVTFVGALKQL